jgi:hypothetical protein
VADARGDPGRLPMVRTVLMIMMASAARQLVYENLFESTGAPIQGCQPIPRQLVHSRKRSDADSEGLSSAEGK